MKRIFFYYYPLIFSLLSAVSSLLAIIGSDVTDSPIFHGCFPPTDVFPLSLFRDWQYIISDHPYISLTSSLLIALALYLYFEVFSSESVVFVDAQEEKFTVNPKSNIAQ